MGKRDEKISEQNVAGKVKWFNGPRLDPETLKDKANYGFITLSDGRGDAFVHGNNVHEQSYPLHDNDEVIFDLVESQRGFKAVNVCRAT